MIVAIVIVIAAILLVALVVVCWLSVAALSEVGYEACDEDEDTR